MKRKVGLIIGYNGEGYFGLQYNQDLKTIEKEIIEVLLETGCITEINSHDPQKINLKACSRTDKGVHASFNLVSAKIIREPTNQVFNELKEGLGAKGIVLYKLVRLSKRFIGHKAARSRIYKYILPTFFLQEGDFEEDWRNLKTSDKGLAVECSGSSDDNCVQDNEPRNSCTNANNDRCTDRSKHRNKIFREYHQSDINPIKGYRSDAIDKLREMLQCYVGTNNYHNFTVKSSQGDAKRFMKSIGASEPFVNGDVEYVEVTVHGQSFLLHQIRKMISFAVLNCKYSRDGYKKNFDMALSPVDVHVPKCPSQYLFLSRVFFEDYNLKSKDEDKIEIDEREKEQFERERIYPSVFSETNLLEWLKYFDAVYFHHERFPLFSSHE